jgi:hypothetical protein
MCFVYGPQSPIRIPASRANTPMRRRSSRTRLARDARELQHGQFGGQDGGHQEK